MKKTIIFFTIIAALSFPLAGASTGTREEADLNSKKGLELYSTLKLDAAVAAFEKALAVYREIGLSQDEGKTLIYIGRTYDKMDRPKDALTYHTEALEVFRRIGDRVYQADCLHDIGLIYSKMGRYDEALTSLGEALTIAVEDGNVRKEAVIRADIADAYLRLGDKEKALSNLAAVVAIADATADKRLRARLLFGAASIYNFMNRPDLTVIQAEKAIEVYREIGDTSGLVTAMILLGNGYLRLSRYEEAIDIMVEAERAAVTEQEKIACLDNLGSAYLAAGDVTEGIVYKKRVLDYYRKTGDRFNEGMALFGLASCSSDDWDQAIGYFNEALDIFQEIDNPIGEGITRAALAFAYFVKKDFKQAKRYCTQVLFIVKKARLEEVIDPLYIGMLHVGTGDYKKAIPFFEKSLIKNRETGNYLEIGFSAAYLGFSYKALGQWEKAVEYYKTAIDVAEKIRAGISAENLRSAFFGGAAFAYDEIIELLIRLGRPEEAFEYMERGRSRSLLDLLGTKTLTVKDKGAQDLVAAEERLRNDIQKLGEKENALFDVGALVSSQEENTRAVVEAQDEYIALTEEIKKQNPELASLITVRALTLEEVKRLLVPGVRIIEYHLAEEMLFIFSLSQDDFAVFTVDISRDDLGDRVTEFRGAVAESLVTKDTTDLLARSRALYDLLLAPVLKSTDEETLIIIPHRTLHYLPFSALSDGDHYLIDTHTLIVDPSASALEFIAEKQKAPAGRIIAFGNPTTKYNPLPFAEREVSTIREIMGGVDVYTRDTATETAGKSRFKDYAVIHLACHGKFKEDDPLLSSLYLASDGSNDGVLSVSELFGLDLKRSSLVVLSACETGLSKVLGGDELIGLSRGFIYAGTPSLLVTLWEVADDSTGALMVEFYRNLKLGVGKPEALRRAQLWLKSQEGYESPYYWSAFEMIGDWR